MARSLGIVASLLILAGIAWFASRPRTPEDALLIEGQRQAPRVNTFTPFSPDPHRIYPPVSQKEAPTVAQLEKRSLQIVDADGEQFASCPSCDGVYNYAIFVGRRGERGGRGNSSKYLFTCPNPQRAVPQDQWQRAPFAGFKKQP
jgi:hypothetical protein